MAPGNKQPLRFRLYLATAQQPAYPLKIELATSLSHSYLDGHNWAVFPRPCFSSRFEWCVGLAGRAELAM
jgi:hypothetical protein